MEAALDKYERAIALLRDAETRKGWLVRGHKNNRRWRRVCLLVDGRWEQYIQEDNKRRQDVRR